MFRYKKMIITCLIIIEMFSLFLTFKSFSNKDINEIKEISKVNNKNFAMYKENSSGGYDEINESVFPSGYSLNMDKSNCVDSNGNILSNILSWNNNKLTIASNKTSYCYLYFDKINGDVYVSVSTDGEIGIVLSSLNYTKSTSCTNGTSEWNNRYNRLEIGSLNGNQVVCSLEYTKDISAKTLLIDVVESKANTKGNGYRYSGKQPNNWIWFNNEKWRIIGSIPACLDSSCSSKENLVKIIRLNSIGGLAFNSSNSNLTWGDNTLYDLLNNYYYGKKDATGSSPCYGYSPGYALCNYTEDGISSDETDYYGKMIKNVYWNVGSVYTTLTIEDSYMLEAATVSSVSGRIGLISVSDYGYASGQTTVELSSLSSYVGNNWLQDSMWTITPNSTTNVMQTLYSGSVSNSSAITPAPTKPVVYLDSSVYIIDGEGTISNPYIIGMN